MTVSRLRAPCVASHYAMPSHSMATPSRAAIGRHRRACLEHRRPQTASRNRARQPSGRRPDPDERPAKQPTKSSLADAMTGTRAIRCHTDGARTPDAMAIGDVAPPPTIAADGSIGAASARVHGRHLLAKDPDVR